MLHLLTSLPGACFGAILLLAAGCSSSGSNGGSDAVNPETGMTPDPTLGVSFEPGHMITVEIEMVPTDWEALKNDNRFGEGGSGKGAGGPDLSECVTPWPNNYDWFEARVTVDGETLERVGIRKKGFVGSQYAAIPAMKIKTDKFVEGQFLGDTERITLNNNSGDPTIMKSCLTFQIFAATGHPAPRCNLADVWVNGEHLGAYTHVEALKKRFLKYAFGDNTGSLYEGTHTDFVEEWLPRWEVKTDDSNPDRAPLLAVAQALQASDDDLVAALEPVVDIDRYITFWALEVIAAHGDGYAADHNNFYLYFDPTDGGRAVFVPWGVDKTLEMPGYSPPIETFLNAHLPRRLSRIPAMAQAMEDELVRIMNEAWDEAAILKSIDRYESQLEVAQSNNPSGVQSLRAWVQGRPAQVTEMLAGGMPVGADDMSHCAGGPGGGKDDPSDPECEDGETFEKDGVTYICVKGKWETGGEKGG